jgi:hypothetical protein
MRNGSLAPAVFRHFIARHVDCSIHDQADGNPFAAIFQFNMEERIMNKSTRALIAAVAALALSGGAYAQAGGGTAGGGGTANGGSSSNGSTASPANQVNDTSGSYGTPGSANSDSGMRNGARNSGLPNSPDNTSTPAPKTNNTLATPSVVSPAAGQ